MFKVTISRIIIIAAFIGIWEYIGQAGLVHHLLLAPPSKVVEGIWMMILNEGRLKDLLFHVRITLTEIVIAFAFVATIGLLLGFIAAEKKGFGDVFEPIATAFASVPNVVLYPAIYLLFGLAEPSKIIFGFILGFFPVVANAIAGFRQVDPAFLTLSKSLGANRITTYAKVIIPGAAPAIVSGLRMGLARTVIGVLAGELLASFSGIGYQLGSASYQYLTAELFGLVLIAASISIIGNQIFAMLESRVTLHHSI